MASSSSSSFSSARSQRQQQQQQLSGPGEEAKKAVDDAANGTGGRQRAQTASSPVARTHNADNLYQFLLSCKTLKDSGDEFSHTSFQRPIGAMYVPTTFVDEFYALYRAALRRGEDLFLTEKHRVVGPVVMDFDFRLAADVVLPQQQQQQQEDKTNAPPPPRRCYGEKTVEEVVRCVSAVIADLMSVPPEFAVYVLQKPHPVPAKGGVVKDGLHLVVPEVVSRPVAQFMMRDALLALPRFQEAMAAEMELLNTLEDVVDKDVIEKNNWTMYGSKKPGCEPYKVTAVYRCCCRGEDSKTSPCVERVEPPFDPVHQADEYVELLSIRNKFEETPLRNDRKAAVKAAQDEIDEQQRKKKALRQALMSGEQQKAVQPSGMRNTSDCYETARRLVAMLSDERASNYTNWIRVGLCLHNVDYRLLADWEEFSQRSAKYVPGECQKLWNNMKLGGLGVGTLHMWAKQDRPEEYKTMIRDDLSALILRTVSNTENDVAHVVYHMYRYEFVCSSMRNRSWYEFRDHRWRRTDCGRSLRLRVSSDVFKEYHNLCSSYHQRVQDTDDESLQRSFSENASKLAAVARRLKCSSFKENVVKECCELFYCERFQELLDSNINLLGFENGVYDLANFEFRDGRPDDHLTFSTGNDYVPFDREHPCVCDIQDFFAKVHPNKNIRNYILDLLASFLSGSTGEERFHIWTGTGSNGKSKVIELFEKAFGDYCCKLPVQLLTSKRCASNAANSEVVQTKGRRFACLQEPSDNERLNIGLMKELTGGDRIMARALFSEPVTFRPQFKMILLCNHVPDANTDDGGTWRRMRLVKFTSEFTRNPVAPNQFPIDTGIAEKFEAWAPHFMSLLLHTFRRNSGCGIHEPDEVLECTRDYQKNNDHYMDFVDTCLERTPQENRDFLLLDDLFQEFKDWVSSDNIPIRVPKKNRVRDTMDRLLGKCVNVKNGVSGYKGYRLRARDGHTNPFEEDEEEKVAAKEKQKAVS